MNDEGEGDRCCHLNCSRAGRLEPDCDAGGIGAEIFDLEHGSQEQASCCPVPRDTRRRQTGPEPEQLAATAGRCSHGSQVLHLSSTPVFRFLSVLSLSMCSAHNVCPLGCMMLGLSDPWTLASVVAEEFDGF